MTDRKDWRSRLALRIAPWLVEPARVTMTARRVPTSSIVEQHPILERALEDARRQLPPGSQVQDTSYPTDDFTLRFDLITEYDPSLCPPGLPPFARTHGEWNAYLSHGDAADEVQKALVEHGRLLGDVYAGKYK